ncbi:MAG: ATP-binding cassette domain-containing protein [Gallintestinimicrobium sp.]
MLSDRKGHHYAFVGRNGSGKSTIVKLILRLYEPDSGEILLNGEKIETFSREQIWKLFGVLFQDYAKYPVSVADNIAPGADAGQRAKIAKAAETSELDNVLESCRRAWTRYLEKSQRTAWTCPAVSGSGSRWRACIIRMRS